MLLIDYACSLCGRVINRSREVRVILQNGRLRQRLLSVFTELSEARARIAELEAMMFADLGNTSSASSHVGGD